MTVALQSSWSITNPQKCFDFQNLWWWIVVRLGVHNYLADMYNRENFMLCVHLASSDSFLFLFYLISFSARRNASVLQLSGGYFDVLLSLLSERNRPHWNPLHFPDELYCPHLGGGGAVIPGEVKWSHCLFFVTLLRMIMFHSWHRPSLSRLFKCSCFPLSFAGEGGCIKRVVQGYSRDAWLGHFILCETWI